uniref:Uncharacterized protein n=1 Tax=Hainan hebius popei arterivirus TaxID=2116439 RepID=A0A2P1GNJ9_9NIDO|nr:hypothetical protein [Hainan hebius popei arterivirus]
MSSRSEEKAKMGKLGISAYQVHQDTPGSSPKRREDSPSVTPQRKFLVMPTSVPSTTSVPEERIALNIRAMLLPEHPQLKHSALEIQYHMDKATQSC